MEVLRDSCRNFGLGVEMKLTAILLSCVFFPQFFLFSFNFVTRIIYLKDLLGGGGGGGGKSDLWGRGTSPLPPPPSPSV